MRYEIGQVIKQAQVMELIYGNSSRPKDILGRHYVKDGQVIAAWHPDAVRMEVINEKGEVFPMDSVERKPVFAVYLPEKRPFLYRIRMTFQDGNTFTSYDPYSFPCQITEKEEVSFLRGEWLDAHRKIGSHKMTLHGVSGTYFAVWAPAAKRVSVVGDFNFWNGMSCPMNRLEDSGIFELFLPDIGEEQLYKFEIKTASGSVSQKADPYAYQEEGFLGHASKIIDINKFQWEDQVWMRNRKYNRMKRQPLAICNVRDGKNLNSDQLFAEDFSHVLFSRCVGLREEKKQNREKMGLCRASYCGGSADGFRQVIQKTHQNGMGVFMEITPGYYSVGEGGMEQFDGTSLFGYSDERIGMDERRGMRRFCFQKPEVVSLVLSSLLFWIREYHVDGLLLEGITDMVAPETNISNNLDAGLRRDIDRASQANREFLRKLVDAVHREDISVILVADEKGKDPCSSQKLFSMEQGFDYYWNYSVRENMNRFLASEEWMKQGEYYRLTTPLQRPGLEESLLVLNPENFSESDKNWIDNLSRDDYDKILAEAKMSAAWLVGVPGRKVFMQQILTESMRLCLHSLFHIYRNHAALYESGDQAGTFEWINCVDAPSSVVSFIRKSVSGGDLLLFISNFSSRAWDRWQVGVPKYGEYKLLFNSDAKEYGGEGRYDQKSAISMREAWDLCPNSIQVSLPPRSTLIFGYQRL